MTVAALIIILALVLIGPLLFKSIEHNIDIFFLVAGVLAALVSGVFGWELMHEALSTPVALTLAVLVFGAIVKLSRNLTERWFESLIRRYSIKLVTVTLIVVLGLIASVITAVIAALVLVEVISLMKLERRTEIRIVVLACFAIGLGAALTPVGEPLSTIAIASLHADFWYLARLLGPIVLTGILIVAIVGLLLPIHRSHTAVDAVSTQGWSDIAIRAGRVYIFVAGLVALSAGMRPVVDLYIKDLPIAILFWLNGISAVVDNATLAAAEVGPTLTLLQQRSILMGLLISGGMLIPGNIPNIVAANRLGIGSREWARTGLVVGLPLMALCFVVLEFIL